MNIYILIIHVQNIYVLVSFKNLHYKALFRSLVCPVGYLGSTCEETCRYPGYGSGCQMDCNCTEEVCDHVHGCNDTTILLFMLHYFNLILETVFPYEHMCNDTTIERTIHVALFLI